jgi:hypothetical protein
VTVNLATLALDEGLRDLKAPLKCGSRTLLSLLPFSVRARRLQAGEPGEVSFCRYRRVKIQGRLDHG